MGPLNSGEQQQENAIIVEYRLLYIDHREFAKLVREKGPKQSLLRQAAWILICVPHIAVAYFAFFLTIDLTNYIYPDIADMNERVSSLIYTIETLLVLAGFYTLFLMSRRQVRSNWNSQFDLKARFDKEGFTQFRQNSYSFVAWKDSTFISNDELCAILVNDGTGYCVPVGKRGLTQSQIEEIRAMIG